MSEPEPYDPFLRLIAVVKLLKALLFICAGLGLLHFMNKDVESGLQHFLDDLHVDQDNKIPKWCLEQASKVTNTKLVTLSAIAFFYATLFATEGTGLYLRKKWAEYFVVIVTGSLLPFEAYEIWLKVTVLKLLITTGNLIVLGYLIYVISRKKQV